MFASIVYMNLSVLEIKTNRPTMRFILRFKYKGRSFVKKLSSMYNEII